MKESMKETREQEEVKENIVEKYENMMQALRKVIGILLYAVITIPAFITCAYIITKQYIGNGPFNYSDTAYGNIAEAIGNNIVEGTDKEGNVIEKYGFDERGFKPLVTDFQLYSDGDDLILKAWKTEGYFTAEVSVRFNENYDIVSTKKNFENRQEYENKFYRDLLICSVGGGVIAWVVFTGVVCGLVHITIVIIKKFSQRNKKEEEKEDSKDEQEENKTEESKAKTSDIVVLSDSASKNPESTKISEASA